MLILLPIVHIKQCGVIKFWKLFLHIFVQKKSITLKHLEYFPFLTFIYFILKTENLKT